MTLEAILERIAIALEKSAAIEAPVTTAEIAAVAEAPKKPARGRPAKITAEEKDASTPAVIEPKKEVAAAVDDFLDAPPAKIEKPATLEDVRKALQVYAGVMGGGAEGTAKARALMTRSSSNGAVRLSVAKDVPGGDQGVLLVTDYAAVVAAAATPK